MRGSGGTEGGLGQYAVGFALAVLAVYLFFDSVVVSTGGHGWVSGAMGHGRGRGIEGVGSLF